MSGSQKIVLEVTTGKAIQSFKNAKRVTPRGGLITRPDVKEGMRELESAIVSALYSSCQTGDGATDSECRKRLRTLLSGLSDDSLNQIPESSFGVEYVEKGREGVRIEIEEIT